MPRPSIWSDAEALFIHAFAWLDASANVAPSLALGDGAAWIGGLGVLAGCALAARLRPSAPLRSSTSLISMTRSLLLLAAVLVAAPALAQTHADPMARLAPFEGTYALDGTPHQAPDGSFDGALTITPTLGGRFQQWDWEMTMRGDGVREDVHLRFIVGHDAATDNYTIHRFDSRDASSPTRSAGAFDSSLGRLVVDGDNLVMAWAMANGNDSSRNGTFRNRVEATEAGLLIQTEGVPDDGSPVVAVATTRATRR